MYLEVPVGENEEEGEEEVEGRQQLQVEGVPNELNILWWTHRGVGITCTTI